MTNHDAASLQTGDIVYGVTWPQRMSPYVTRLQYVRRGEFNKWEMVDGSLWVASRLHFTKDEANQHINELIKEKIISLLALLRDWQIKAVDPDYAAGFHTHVHEGVVFVVIALPDKLVSVQADQECHVVYRPMAVRWLIEHGLPETTAESLVKDAFSH